MNKFLSSSSSDKEVAESIKLELDWQPAAAVGARIWDAY